MIFTFHSLFSDCLYDSRIIDDIYVSFSVSDCLYDSRVIGDGRSFIRAGSPCQQCRCVGGNIECHIVGRCPRLPCAVTEMTPDHCCPQCKGLYTIKNKKNKRKKKYILCLLLNLAVSFNSLASKRLL